MPSRTGSRIMSGYGPATGLGIELNVNPSFGPNSFSYQGRLMNSLLQSIPSPTKLRDELERMVIKDLLGPVGGPEEEVDEPSVRDRYLVGMLAPKRQELSPEEFDELPQGGSSPAEDGTAEATSPANKTMFPSSFGMTFCVGLDARVIQVSA